MSNIINYLEYKNTARIEHEVYTAYVDTLTLTNNWETLVTLQEYNIIREHMSNNVDTDLQHLGQLVDVIEVKRAGRANGYLLQDDDSRYETLHNNPHIIVEGNPPADTTKNRVYVCFYEYGMLIVSGTQHYSTLYDNWMQISTSGDVTVIMVYPETVQHKQDADANIADPHQYSMASKTVIAILQLFSAWMKKVGHPVVLDFEPKQN